MLNSPIKLGLGNMIQRLVVSCHTKEDLDTWISFFKQYHHVCHSVTPPVVALRSIQNQHLSSSQVDSSQNNNSHVSQLQITLAPNAQQPPLPPHVTVWKFSQSFSFKFPIFWTNKIFLLEIGWPQYSSKRFTQKNLDYVESAASSSNQNLSTSR